VRSRKASRSRAVVKLIKKPFNFLVAKLDANANADPYTAAIACKKTIDYRHNDGEVAVGDRRLIFSFGTDKAAAARAVPKLRQCKCVTSVMVTSNWEEAVK
jgi:hypothetical protein